MSDPQEPAQERTRLSPWLSRELHKALDERDPETIFMILGDYLEYQKLHMPTDRIADWQAARSVRDRAGHAQPGAE